jgi:hypothetical protein
MFLLTQFARVNCWTFGSPLTSSDRAYHICGAFGDMQTDGLIG